MCRSKKERKYLSCNQFAIYNRWRLVAGELHLVSISFHGNRRHTLNLQSTAACNVEKAFAEAAKLFLCPTIENFKRKEVLTYDDWWEQEIFKSPHACAIYVRVV